MKKVPFTYEFLNALNPTVEQSRTYAREVIRLEALEFVEAYEDEEGPLLAWGINPMWRSVGSLWIIFDVRCAKPATLRRVIRLARGRLNEAFEHFVRVEAIFHTAHPTYKIARHMGFQIEGILRNYGLGGEGDYVVASRIAA